jgi:cytochrome c553
MCLAGVLAWALVLVSSLAPDRAQAAPDAALARGEYLVHAGACASCHTDQREGSGWLAGGRELKSPYGTFHVPNITPDPETGIGRWTEEDFVRAMTEGLTPEGQHYYPIFPYAWYRNMVLDDMRAMWAYLRTVPPVRNQVRDHELMFPFSIRFFLIGWKLLNLEVAPDIDPKGDPMVARGDYLVNALGHCAACHTPSGPIYIYTEADYLSGHVDIPGSYTAPNITPDPVTGIGDWSDEDIARSLAIGMRPDGTPLRGPMADYVAAGSRHLTPEDHAAITAYLRAIPPLANPVPRVPTPTAFPEMHDEAPTGGAPLGADVELGRAVAMGVGAEPQRACYRCHPVDGADPASDGLPRLDRQGPSYLERQLVAYADGTRRNPVMSPIAASLTPAERSAVAAYYASLPGPEVPPLPAETGPSRGRILAESGDPALGVPACIACHGTLGIGVPPSAPYLAGQDALYMAQQFAFWRTGARANDPLAVMRKIARKLLPADAQAVSDHFASLAEPPPPAPLAMGE